MPEQFGIYSFNPDIHVHGRSRTVHCSWTWLQNWRWNSDILRCRADFERRHVRRSKMINILHLILSRWYRRCARQERLWKDNIPQMPCTSKSVHWSHNATWKVCLLIHMRAGPDKVAMIEPQSHMVSPSSLDRSSSLKAQLQVSPFIGQKLHTSRSVHRYSPEPRETFSPQRHPSKLGGRK